MFSSPSWIYETLSPTTCHLDLSFLSFQGLFLSMTFPLLILYIILILRILVSFILVAGNRDHIIRCWIVFYFLISTGPGCCCLPSVESFGYLLLHCAQAWPELVGPTTEGVLLREPGWRPHPHIIFPFQVTVTQTISAFYNIWKSFGLLISNSYFPCVWIHYISFHVYIPWCSFKFQKNVLQYPSLSPSFSFLHNNTMFLTI